jgi:hypothetical protein
MKLKVKPSPSAGVSFPEWAAELIKSDDNAPPSCRKLPEEERKLVLKDGSGQLNGKSLSIKLFETGNGHDKVLDSDIKAAGCEAQCKGKAAGECECIANKKKCHKALINEWLRVAGNVDGKTSRQSAVLRRRAVLWHRYDQEAVEAAAASNRRLRRSRRLAVTDLETDISSQYSLSAAQVSNYHDLRRLYTDDRRLSEIRQLNTNSTDPTSDGRQSELTDSQGK